MNPRRIEDKLLTETSLKSLCADLHRKGQKIVTTNGCFDLIHWGHIKYLSRAREMGDCLIVGINSDRSVRGLGKGEDRPLVTEKYRALQIAGLESVDWIYIFDEPTPEKFLEIVRPAIHAKGGDYHGKSLPESAVVEGGGGKIALVPLEAGFSTTALVDKIRKN